MAMSSSTAASSITSDYDILKGKENVQDDDYLLKLIEVYLDTEFQNGIVSDDNVDITTPAGTLSLPVSPVDTMAKVIGDACETYWKNTIEKTGIPQHTCGNNDSEIISVTNTAEGISAKIELNLKAIGGSTTELTPSFEKFCEAIIDEVKKIEWTVEESGTNPPALPCDKTYTVTIS